MFLQCFLKSYVQKIRHLQHLCFVGWASPNSPGQLKRGLSTSLPPASVYLDPSTQKSPHFCTVTNDTLNDDKCEGSFESLKKG